MLHFHVFWLFTSPSSRRIRHEPSQHRNSQSRPSQWRPLGMFVSSIQSPVQHVLELPRVCQKTICHRVPKRDQSTVCTNGPSRSRCYDLDVVDNLIQHCSIRVSRWSWDAKRRFQFLWDRKDVLIVLTCGREWWTRPRHQLLICIFSEVSIDLYMMHHNNDAPCILNPKYHLILFII